MSKSNSNHGLDIFSLKGKTVLVTGAAGLIGSEISAAMSAAGAEIVLVDQLPNSDISSKFAQKSGNSTASTLAISTDITDRDSVDSMTSEAVERFGKIDILVHLAAIDAKFDQAAPDGADGRFETFPIDLWKRSIDVNITGTFNVTQSICKQMLIQNSGNIILTASTYSLVGPNNDLYTPPAPGNPMVKPVDYVATKSFIPNYTRYLATHYAKQRIRVNCITPHGVENENPDWFKENFAKLSPMGRMSDASELNGPFVFLASDASSYMTGSTLVVDGGWTAW
ncbi:MAG: SDR family oxidoreductase [Chloroflexi bacterium]|jgi:NAD(P)-dependent dehydrogenase (short-subunit alcohol dehydrogenase family)|nr:SDR family oxidoreductase [Chloroflexota bacterium]